MVKIDRPGCRWAGDQPVYIAATMRFAPFERCGISCAGYPVGLSFVLFLMAVENCWPSRQDETIGGACGGQLPCLASAMRLKKLIPWQLAESSAFLHSWAS